MPSKVKKPYHAAVEVEKPEWLELLNEDIVVPALVESLAFDQDQVEQAGSVQAKLYYDASRYHLKVWKRLASLKAKLEVARAEAGLRVRSMKDAAGRKAHTEAAIAEKVTLNSAVRALSRKIDAVSVQEKYAKLLSDSYIQRQSALKVVSETRNAEINGAVRQVKMNMAVDGMREKMEQVRARTDAMPFGKVKWLKSMCSVCKKQQFRTSAGVSCVNGHGGAESAD